MAPLVVLLLLGGTRFRLLLWGFGGLPGPRFTGVVTPLVVVEGLLLVHTVVVVVVVVWDGNEDRCRCRPCARAARRSAALSSNDTGGGGKDSPRRRLTVKVEGLSSE